MRYILPILLLASTLEAAALKDKDQLEVLNNFSDGLVTSVPAHKITKTGSPNMQNFYIDKEQTSLCQRAGYNQVGSTNTLNDGRFQFTFNKEDGTRKFIVSDASTVLSTEDWQTYVFISSGLNDTTNLHATQLRNKVWFANGSDDVFTWDDSVKVVLDGDSGKADPPVFTYVTSYQNRIFGGNTATNGSLLTWSLLIDTAGVPVAPDDRTAWVDDSQLNIGQGDGEVITGLKVFNGQLYIFKEKSIYALFGTDPDAYFERRLFTSVGTVSQETVVEQDGVLKFLDADGVYEISPDGLIRISDAIIPDIDSAIKDTVRIVADVWETEDDFKAGNFFSGTTVTATGVLTVFTGTFAFVNDPPLLNTEPGLDFNEAGHLITTHTITITTDAVSPESLWTSGNEDQIFSAGANVSLRTKSNNCGSVATDMKVQIVNTRTGFAVVRTESHGADQDSYGLDSFNFQFGTSSIFFTGQDIIDENLQMEILISSMNGAAGGCEQYFTVGFPTESGKVVLTGATTGQFKSEVTTITSLTAWSNFESLNNTLGGTVEYFFRTSTSAVNITTKTWSNIPAGAKINEPVINNYFQWATTISAVSRDNPTNVDNVEVKHIEGSGAKTKAFAKSWKNRFWLSIATETTGNFPVIYVESLRTNANPHAWVRFNGVNVRSFGNDGSDVLYGGHVSTGVFYRLDDGTNDDGKAIDAFWETKELDFGIPFQDKKLVELLIDADRDTGLSMTIGGSIEAGDFTDISVDLDGSNRLIKSLRDITDYNNYSRFRIRNNVLDTRLVFHNLGIVWTPQEVRSNTE